eukprot:SAG11_NODE_213_length_12262_cov_8.391597_11_plen_164_part_00
MVGITRAAGVVLVTRHLEKIGQRDRCIGVRPENRMNVSLSTYTRADQNLLLHARMWIPAAQRHLHEIQEIHSHAFERSKGLAIVQKLCRQDTMACRARRSFGTSKIRRYRRHSCMPARKSTCTEAHRSTDFKNPFRQTECQCCQQYAHSDKMTVVRVFGNHGE